MGADDAMSNAMDRVAKEMAEQAATLVVDRVIKTIKSAPIADPTPVVAWAEAQREELAYWGNATNTWTEEVKQELYFRKMGFHLMPSGNSAHTYDGGGKSYLDVGGGPVSILLKFVNCSRRRVVDPCRYPDWVFKRYEEAGIEYEQVPAESMREIAYDVCLLYNVLQHTIDPEKVVRNCLAAASEFKCFEWIDIPPHPGHPHLVTADQLRAWSGKQGEVGEFHGVNECFGRAWYC